MGIDVPARPTRLGPRGVARTQTLREVEHVARALREQARADGTTLSDVYRDAGRAYLTERGWSLDTLIHGNKKARDDEWQARLGRRDPKN